MPLQPQHPPPAVCLPRWFQDVSRDVTRWLNRPFRLYKQANAQPNSHVLFSIFPASHTLHSEHFNTANCSSIVKDSITTTKHQHHKNNISTHQNLPTLHPTTTSTCLLHPPTIPPASLCLLPRTCPPTPASCCNTPRGKWNRQLVHHQKDGGRLAAPAIPVLKVHHLCPTASPRAAVPPRTGTIAERLPIHHHN